MKKCLALLTAVLLLMTCACADGSDGTAVSSAAVPMEANAYMDLLTGLLRSISADYAGSWRPMRDSSGEYMLTDGSGRDGVPFLRLSLHDARVTAITVSYPWYAENRNASVQQIGIWSVLAAAPVAMQSGMSADEAQALIGNQLEPLMNGRIGTTHTVCGMEAVLSLTETAVTVRYVFPGTPEPRMLPVGTDVTGSLSAEDYMREFDDRWAELYGQRLVWSAPEQAGDVSRIVCTTLHSPTLYTRDDRILCIAGGVLLSPEDPSVTLRGLSSWLNLTTVPILRLQGMGTEEAEAAFGQWLSESGLLPGAVCALNGEVYTTAFCGFTVHLGLVEDGSSLGFLLTVPGFSTLE